MCTFLCYLFVYNIHKAANTWATFPLYHNRKFAVEMWSKISWGTVAPRLQYRLPVMAGVLPGSRAVQSRCSRNIQTASNLAVVMQPKCNSYENNLTFLGLGFWILISLPFNLFKKLSGVSYTRILSVWYLFIYLLSLWNIY